VSGSGEAGDGSGALWRVGIQDPRDRSRIAEIVQLGHGVATSGDAARGAHLYDPATGTFVQRTGSVTVVGPTLMWADVAATALFAGVPGLLKSSRWSPAATHDRAVRVVADGFWCE
jgi:thiamine biosynthesis lipoprotein ApbE